MSIAGTFDLPQDPVDSARPAARADAPDTGSVIVARAGQAGGRQNSR